MKIGVFGGTFDPVHLGHVALVEMAVRELSLDLLYVIPNGNPPHKDEGTKKEHRFQMVKTAFAPIPKVTVCDYEICKTTYSYTYETLAYLKEKHPQDTLYFLMGMDNVPEIFGWKKPEEICRLAHLAFFGRPGYEGNKDGIFRLQEQYRVEVETVPFSMKISSTEIRKRIGEGYYIFDQLSLPVVSYIFRHGLYGCTPVKEYDLYQQDLKNYIEEKRFRHSIGVACTAYLLALRYGEDCKMAYLAGLLHDIAKRMPLDVQQKLCNKIELHPDELKYPKMLHAPAGAGFVKKQYGIKDKKLLSAIRYHTMGHKDMTLFEKILYMADYIEPGREFDGVEALREVSFSDLDRAIMQGIDTTILSLVEEHLKISPVLLDVRNALIEQEEKGC